MELAVLDDAVARAVQDSDALALFLLACFELGSIDQARRARHLEEANCPCRPCRRSRKTRLRWIVTDSIEMKVAIVEPENATLHHDHGFQSGELVRILEVLAGEEALQSGEALVLALVCSFLILISSRLKGRLVASEEPRGLVREALGVLAEDLAGADPHARFLEVIPLVVLLAFQNESRVSDGDHFAWPDIDDEARPAVLLEGELTSLLDRLDRQVRHPHKQRFVCELVRVASDADLDLQLLALVAVGP